MEKQLAQSGVLVQRIALVLMALVLAIGAGILGVYTFQVSDPYIQDVLSLKGEALRGQAIFQINCAGCHGSQGDGRVGPSLQHISKRKSEVGVIHQVISGQTPPMPKFQPSPQEMADLLSYLEEL
ncbi:c-type cytochrome [Coleofasciculus sp. LEGE 07081]|uniref:c-type cytochrome n=1 Tax=unclassified Coleofasciculus TaxID=2692782 RepID=UPI00187E796E|nr:cytochrome c [Coleofasciculus sp. LEGE 07081]MBE9152477.1 cytochrome c [Coleofasciculus sp. LEGE 07092]